MSDLIYTNGTGLRMFLNTAGSSALIWHYPYNPLDLPPNTVRVRTNDNAAPVKRSGWTKYETATLVEGTTNVYDVYKSDNNFDSLLFQSTNVIEILGANTKSVSSMSDMCYTCTALTSVALFDVSNVVNVNNMFGRCSNLVYSPAYNTSNAIDMSFMYYYCTSLSAVPLLQTQKVTNFNGAFASCRNVETGALALYNQISTQANPPSNHQNSFTDCGAYTVEGAAELAQIPADWK